MKQDTFIRQDSLPDEGRLDDEPRDYWRALIDVTVTLVRHWKLLIAGPLIAGAVAYAGASLLPKPYVSSAYIGPIDDTTSKMAVTVLFSPPVLNAALQKFPQYLSWAVTDDERRLHLAKKIKFKGTVDPKFLSLYVLEVEDTEPARAQGIAAALIGAWLVATKPPPERLASLERLTESNDSQLTDLSMAISQLLKHPELLSPDVKTGYAPVNIAEMIKLRGESVKRSEELKAAIAGLSSDLIFSPPSLPDMPVGPVKREIVFRAMQITFAVLILFVLLRHMISVGMASPLYGPKLKQIWNAMRWRRSPV
jgi:LPS O-antigen subunit length determinant protein (WzzB/FepE family)